MVRRLVSVVWIAALVACGGDEEPVESTETTPSTDLTAGTDTPTPPTVTTPTDTTTPTTSRTPLDCEVAIIGGGAGGLHTAFRLAPELGEGVCLFEKNDRLGGRIYDIALDPLDPASPVVGVGARRVMEGQQVLFDLADELGLVLEVPPPAGDLLQARGAWATAKQDFVPLYDGSDMLLASDPYADQETFLYEELMYGAGRADIDAFADFRSYVQAVTGFEGFNFLHDMSRFRADFEYALSARGYMDYLDEEWNVCCTASYPVGGMSTFIDGMADGTTAAGGRVFTSEPVGSVNRDGAGFVLTTDSYVVTADKVVVAVPPIALEWIEGDVIDDLQAQAQMQDIVAVKVATVTQWWPSSWWEDVVDPATGDPIWRAWTTDHCLNFIEIPQEPSLADAHVTRSAYQDNLDCALFWEGLAAEGEDAVAAEIKTGLEYLFVANGVTNPPVIPEPLKTHVQIWPDAWHWLRAGTAFTNDDIYEWAVEPLPGEQVGLVGEAYNVNRSGWSDGAYKSSIHLLNTQYGMSLPGI